jgi:ubiquinone/menaquinone biosynthesis C-methylase UbiE
MIKQKKGVDWARYARSYDMLLSYNPFYQQLHQDVLEHARNWSIASDDLILDLGAGTGNYSLALATHFPQAQVLHIEPNEGMNLRTREKKDMQGLENLNILPRSVEDVKLSPNSAQACVCIHALYTFSDPAGSVGDIYQWLKPGGQAILVDPGRKVKILEWQFAIGWHLLRKHGWAKALEIMRSGKEVSNQNTYIRKKQLTGEYWLHTLEEFIKTVENAGFKVLEAKKAFRKVSDFVVLKKPG